MKTRMIYPILLGFLVCFIILKVRIKTKTEIKKIEDKFIVGDRGASPHYFIITRDSLGEIEQENVTVEQFAEYKIGHKYELTNLTLIIKK